MKLSKKVKDFLDELSAWVLLFGILQVISVNAIIVFWSFNQGKPVACVISLVFLILELFSLTWAWKRS